MVVLDVRGVVAVESQALPASPEHLSRRETASSPAQPVLPLNHCPSSARAMGGG